MHHLRAAANLTAILLVSAALVPLQYAWVRVAPATAHRVPRWFHRALCWIIGVRLRQLGEIAQDRPLLFAINHASWLDIVVFGSITPVCFVAKKEVATWPFFGLLARLQRTVFVDRQRHATAAHRDEMVARLNAGERVGLFPEGTSSDGNRVLPFKSAFFAVAEQGREGKPLAVQPVSISYVGLNGLPLGREGRPTYAWYADMDLLPHLWGVLAAGPVTVVVQFHPVVTIEAFGSRKALARYCEETVAQGVSDAISGRLWRPAQTPAAERESPPTAEAPA